MNEALDKVIRAEIRTLLRRDFDGEFVCTFCLRGAVLNEPVVHGYDRSEVEATRDRLIKRYSTRTRLCVFCQQVRSGLRSRRTLKRDKLDRVDLWGRGLFMLLSWVMFLALGILAWNLGGLAWFAYAAVMVLNGIFWEVESSRLANVESERATWGIYHELRRIRKRLPKTPHAG